MTIGDRIKNRREELNMSQEELALKLGYKSRSSINKIEVDGRGLPQSKIKAIADVLGTTPSYIMGWVDEWDEKYNKDDKIAEDVQRYDNFSTKDNKDIATTMNFLLEQLDNNYQDALMFDGEPLDDESRELLKSSLENSLKMGKMIAKQKYTSKKYRK